MQPIVYPFCGNNRRKFSYVDDNFLFLALKQIGPSKDYEEIKENWLPKKNLNEIKHRIKNLTCRRAPDNFIKRWKAQHSLPLREGWMTEDGALGAKAVSSKVNENQNEN